MKKNKHFLSWFLLLYLFILGSCGDSKKDEVTPEPDDSRFFVSAESKGTVQKPVLQLFAQAAGFGSLVSKIKYDVAFFKFTYKTTYKDNEIEASGLLAIPQNTPGPPALLSAQHGTMFAQADAPSNFPVAFTGFELFATTGFITVIPDYIGFGASKEIFHPYFDQKHSAQAVVDMLKAAKWYLQDKKIAINNNLFLIGYSEGGYVTLAAQKEIETNSAHKLTLTAVAAGAGGYDLSAMLTAIAAAPTYSNPAFLAYLVQAYNTTYGWNRPLTDFFKEPYATNLPALFNGTKRLNEINNALAPSPAALFNATFYANLQNPAGEATLKQALTNNSFLTWIPQNPTRLYHGTADEAVFYQTTETTYNRFIAAGATNVTLVPIPGGTHVSSIEPMMLNALSWFESLNK